MMKDYFERKKIWFCNSPGNLFLGIICVLIIMFFSWASFLYVYIWMCTLSKMETEMKPKIEQLLPFSKEEKRKRYLTDLVLNLILFSVPLFLNVLIMYGYKEKPEMLAYPVYTAINFLSFFILIAHTSIGFGILKCSGLSRVKQNYENANLKMKVYEFFTYFFRIILAINLALEGALILIKSINLPTSALDAQLITYTTTFVSIGIVFLLFDMIRTLGGKNEY